MEEYITSSNRWLNIDTGVKTCSKMQPDLLKAVQLEYLHSLHQSWNVTCDK